MLYTYHILLFVISNSGQWQSCFRSTSSTAQHHLKPENPMRNSIRHRAQVLTHDHWHCHLHAIVANMINRCIPRKPEKNLMPPIDTAITLATTPKHAHADTYRGTPSTPVPRETSAPTAPTVGPSIRLIGASSLGQLPGTPSHVDRQQGDLLPNRYDEIPTMPNSTNNSNATLIYECST